MQSKEFLETPEEMEKLLQEETTGYLGLCADGEPYVVPLNHAYVDGKILVHCATTGKKLDYIRANPQVCYTVGRQSGVVRRHAEGKPCHMDSDSVICYGTARIVEDLEERKAVLDAFYLHYRPDAKGLALESVAKCCAIEIQITEMTGRRERGPGTHRVPGTLEEQKRTYWRYSFPE